MEDTLAAVGPQVHQLGHSVHSSLAGRAQLSHTFRGLVSNRTDQAGQAYAFRLRRCVFPYGENTRADPGKKWDEGADTEARACYNTTGGCVVSEATRGLGGRQGRGVAWEPPNCQPPVLTILSRVKTLPLASGEWGSRGRGTNPAWQGDLEEP